MITEDEVTIVAHDSHRNGVMGQRFEVVLFDFRPDGEKKAKRMLAVLLPEVTALDLGSVGCFVLDVKKLTRGEVRFGRNSWRGDEFAPVLRRLLAAESRAEGVC